ncbi:MAG: arginyltransferase [Myxococcales bacterium]|nr:arginyltransferase [Myxococcales bacterium]
MRVIWDRPEACPYLPNREARLPLRVADRMVKPAEFDVLLEEGDRRSGRFLYRASCGSCSECRPLRVPIAEFSATTSQRRSVRKNQDVTVRILPPDCTPRHLDLYNRHKIGRGLSRSGEPLDEEGYRRWLVDTCVDTVEAQYFVGERMIAVSILDLGETSVSSVYHYFDPEDSNRSMGVYSVLWELAWCRVNNFKWYYLGYYVKDCNHLNYKDHYSPNEKKIDGVWVR